MIGQENSKTELIKVLKSLGLTIREAEVYLYLLEKGSLSALEISRQMKIGRTTIYRTLEAIQQKGLISEEIRDKGRLFFANPHENLNLFLVDREQKLHSLEKALPEIMDSLSLLAQEDVSKSKVLYYSGIEGLKKVLWNETDTKGIFRIFEVGLLEEFMDPAFSEKIMQEFVKKKIYDHQLTNIANYKEKTSVTEFVEEYWKLRYIDPKELKMEFEMKIYNDVYVMYDVKDGEPFCVEIYNSRLAEMQKQIFDFMWANAKPMKFINNTGTAIIDEESN